ncbi:unnamed protein product [Blumeria hordei]|uniref:Uncharacterized protein n=1 Tax=Blumeria hordei TaxID=2867405 RepID=A0A383UKE6_BLUHO|nr:unnamed protein product [Blumeria hordei]
MTRPDDLKVQTSLTYQSSGITLDNSSLYLKWRMNRVWRVACYGIIHLASSVSGCCGCTWSLCGYLNVN